MPLPSRADTIRSASYTTTTPMRPIPIPEAPEAISYAMQLKSMEKLVSKGSIFILWAGLGRHMPFEIQAQLALESSNSIKLQVSTPPGSNTTELHGKAMQQRLHKKQI